MLQLPKRDTGWDFFFSGSIVVRDPSRATPGDGQHFVLLRAFSEACVPWVTHSGVEGTSGAPEAGAPTWSQRKALHQDH